MIKLEDDILELEGIEEYRRKRCDTYKWDNLGIPRVTNIIETCSDNKYLINWAARLGYQGYAIETKKATTIGSRVHEMIENYLLNGNDLDVSFKTPPSYMRYILQSYQNFKNWFLFLASMRYNIEVLAIEKELVCPWYGGTCDGIVNINGKNYIIDFKTSKKISPSYILQTCAYMWIINSGYANDIPHIDGVGIIRGDKEKEKFEDYFLNESYSNDANIIRSFQETFFEYVNVFYRNINIDQIFRDHKKQYTLKDVLERE